MILSCISLSEQKENASSSCFSAFTYAASLSSAVTTFLGISNTIVLTLSAIASTVGLTVKDSSNCFEPPFGLMFLL